MLDRWIQYFHYTTIHNFHHSFLSYTRAPGPHHSIPDVHWLIVIFPVHAVASLTPVFVYSCRVLTCYFVSSPCFLSSSPFALLLLILRIAQPLSSPICFFICAAHIAFFAFASISFLSSLHILSHILLHIILAIETHHKSTYSASSVDFRFLTGLPSSYHHASQNSSDSTAHNASMILLPSRSPVSCSESFLIAILVVC